MPEIIDAWMRLPNRPCLLDPMFDSLRRWPMHTHPLAQYQPGTTHEQALDSFRAQGVALISPARSNSLPDGYCTLRRPWDSSHAFTHPIEPA
jgi:hypothetical protein